MIKIFGVYQKGNNNLLIKVTCYDKKIYNTMLKQFKKIKQVYTLEVENAEERP